MSPIPCPACSRFLPESPTSCPGCHLPLTGPNAARLWQVDQDLTVLQRERTVLIAALRAQGGLAAGQPTPTLTDPFAQGGAATAADAPAAGAAGLPAPTAARRSWTTQQTLLAVGVLLVLVAGSIALAIAWFLIGLVGQLVVMGGFTAAATAAALVLSRRGLPSSAEALAVVAGGLLLLDLSAARRFGLAGLDSVDGRTYAAVTGLLAALVLAALHQRDRRIAAFALLSLTAASIGWAGVVGIASSSSGVAALALVGAVLFGVLHLVIPTSFGLTRRAATGPAAGWTVVAAGAAAIGALGAGIDALDARSGSDLDGPLVQRLTTDGLVSGGLLAAVAVAGALTVRRVVAVRTTRLGTRAAVRADWTTRPFSGDWRALGVVALVASVAGPAAILGLGLQLGAFWSAVLAVLTAVVGTSLAVARSRTTSLGTAWLETQTGAALGVLVLVCSVDGSRPATTIALTATALVAATAAVNRPTWRAAASGTAGVTAVWALWLAGGLVGPRTQWALLATTALALVALAVWRRYRAEELVLGALAVLVAIGAVAVALDRSWPHAASVTAAAYGLTAVAYAALPHRRFVVTVAVGALTTAVWVELAEADVTTLEARTVPLAALLLGAGLWSHRQLGDRSWLTAGPGLVVALLPSALFTTADDGLVRPLLTVCAAVLVLVVGALQRWQALVVVGAAAAAIVALSQLLPYAMLLPRYLTLGTLGVALLAVGARYEQRRADARQAVSWLASMS